MNATPVQQIREVLPFKVTDRWAVILAGGDGTRLRSMTLAISGDDRPKQFCPIIGPGTLFDQTRERLAPFVTPNRSLIVVTKKHQRFYKPLVNTLQRDLLVEQPSNKGTAPAILYALMRIATKSPRAIVGLFPSDHFIADNELFISHVESACQMSQTRPETVTLFGITPNAPEVEYGWIEPQPSILGSLAGSITRVQRFWEKPDVTTAQNLLAKGCLWNSFVIVGRVDYLLRMIMRAVPELYQSFVNVVPTFGSEAETTAIQELYSRIPETNFSHEVLAMRASDLAVMRVSDIGWSDLGEPSRVLATLERIGVQSQFAA